MLTQSELKELFDYDPESGSFMWKVAKAKSIKVGDVAGNLRSDGYRRIKINKKIYFEHRLTWLYNYGEWPEKEIDHINGIKTDNRIENLREANRSENGMNRSKQINNTSGFKGVSWNKAAQRWNAYIWINNNRKHLGYFDSPEEAYAAYCKAAKELHGEFANVE